MARRILEPRTALFLIAAFKLVKALLLLAVAVGALRLLHRDDAVEIYRWANTFRVDRGNRLIQRLLARVSLLNAKELQALGIGTFLYSAVFFTEGIGLFLEKRWAEYFTIIVTSSFIPLEIYEIVRRVTFPRVTVLILNIIVVIYLGIDLKRRKGERSAAPTFDLRSEPPPR